MRDTETLSPFIVMTSRRKSKRSVSLRTSSFIRKLSPFQRGLDREDDSPPGDQELTQEATETQEAHEDTGGFSGSFLQTALSDPQLHVSSLACSGTGSHISCHTSPAPNTEHQSGHNLICQHESHFHKQFHCFSLILNSVRF